MIDVKKTGTYLDKILADTAELLSSRDNLLTAPPKEIPLTRGFSKALTKDGISLIAEVKKASPSKGVICENFDPQQIAIQYEKAGASAISVLTDEKYFQGKLEYLQLVRDVSILPLIRKDFIIHPAQIYEAVGISDAILLIVAALEKEQLRDFYQLATCCGLDVLTEVHNIEELEIAIDINVPIIGINNRNLHTFHVDLQHTFDLLPYIPKNKIIVSESGINNKSQVQRLLNEGVDAILVGESLVASGNIESKVAELLLK
jgi:indole-3-glycerol phosphate synthase